MKISNELLYINSASNRKKNKKVLRNIQFMI